jgi:hypothetical protein
MKRRLQTDKVRITTLTSFVFGLSLWEVKLIFSPFQVKLLEMLHLSADFLRDISQVVVYDAASEDSDAVCPDSFTHIALTKLRTSFPKVFLLKGIQLNSSAFNLIF